MLDRQGGTEWGVEAPWQIEPMIRRYAALLGAARGAVGVGLERWAAHRGYRRSRLAALGLAPLDDATGRQADYGGGSSFAPGGAAPDARALAARWRALAGEPEFERLALLAARDDAFMGALAPLYPEDAARLARLARGGRLRDER